MQKAQKSINTDEVKQQIINIMNDNNKEFDENDCFLMNLLTIILDDCQNYPNFSHTKTIINVDNFLILYYKQYNEIKLKYEFEEENINDNKIRLFGESFVEHNKQNCFLIINKNIMEFKSLIDLKDIFDNNIPQIRPIILDVKLIERKNQLMDDLSYMFSDISTIREINFYKYNSHNIKSISYMFNNCSSIKELPDISSLNTIKVTDMSYIFNNCSSIKNLPDISKWDTRNVTNMSYIFNNCSSIKNLPDISKWNTRNVTNMSCMFYNCISLEILPDISSWNIKRLTSYSYMFCGCKLIPNFEILSKWKLTDKSQIETMFQGFELFIEQIRSRRNCNFSDYLISICKNLRKCCCKICEFFCKYFCKLVALIVYLIILLWIITILIFPFYPYYSSFHLGNKKKIILKIKQNLKLINKTNITRISSFLNITNSSLIKEMSENKEGVISNILDNITKKNNISLGKNQKTFKVYSIIIAITTIVNIIFCPLFALSLYYNFYKKIYMILVIMFIIDSISIIIEILELLIDKKLLDSINKINLELKDIFQISFVNYFPDNDYLLTSLIAISVKLITDIIVIIIILILLADLLEGSGRISFYDELLRLNVELN